VNTTASIMLDLVLFEEGLNGTFKPVEQKLKSNARVFALTCEEATNGNDVVTGTLPFNYVDASHSFISVKFIACLSSVSKRLFVYAAAVAFKANRVN